MPHLWGSLEAPLRLPWSFLCLYVPTLTGLHLFASVQTENPRPDLSVVELSPRLRPNAGVSELVLQTWRVPGSPLPASPTGQWDRTGGFIQKGAICPTGKQKCSVWVPTYTRRAPEDRPATAQASMPVRSTGGASPSRKRCYAGANTSSDTCASSPATKKACGAVDGRSTAALGRRKQQQDQS